MLQTWDQRHVDLLGIGDAAGDILDLRGTAVITLIMNNE